MPPDGTPLRKLCWDEKKRAAYAQTVRGIILSGVDGAGKAQSFLSQVSTVAIHSGMKMTGGAKSCTRHKPFFDQECRELKAAVAACCRQAGSPQDLKSLEHRYHNLTRSKRRAYERQQLQHLLVEQRSNPRHFWKRLRGATRSLPVQLLSVHAWNLYLQNLAAPVLPRNTFLPPQGYPERPASSAACLNCLITLDEVLNHLKKLHNGRACGGLGIVSEVLRYAIEPVSQENPNPQHALAHHLTDLLNCFFNEGVVPAILNHAIVTPVYKKGDRTDCSNYRPIAVTEPVMRLYAGILNARLLDYTEKTGIRASAQAGFRPHLSTLHPLLALQHFIDKQFHSHGSLYCCFLDLKSAYDTVQRPLLWEALRRLGIHGKMLGALQSMYIGSTLSVNIQGRIGKQFVSEAGVKQGCPLSPTLFGIFLDGLEGYLKSWCEGIGPKVSDGNAVPVLMYADDIALLATSEADLQMLIGQTGAFCKHVGLSISPAKSTVVVFSKESPVLRPFSCYGNMLTTSDKVKYLGLQFHAKFGLLDTCGILYNKMVAAWAVLRREYAGLRCSVSVPLLLKLYRACIPPVASYGCELWGMRRLPAEQKKQASLMGKKHDQILCSITGLRLTTPKSVLFKELGDTPLPFVWAERTATFWNNLSALPEDNMFKIIALDNCRDAVLHKVRNWSQDIHLAFNKKNFPVPLRPSELVAMDKASLTFILRENLIADFQGLDVSPRTSPSQGSKLCTYINWFAVPSFAVSNLFQVKASASLLRGFLRFSGGCHNLPIDSGRTLRIARRRRSCPKCSSSSICDELHVVFECQALQGIRQKYSHIFTGQTLTMRQFMWQKDLLSVMHYVRESLQLLLS